MSENQKTDETVDNISDEPSFVPEVKNPEQHSKKKHKSESSSHVTSKKHKHTKTEKIHEKKEGKQSDVISKKETKEKKESKEDLNLGIKVKNTTLRNSIIALIILLIVAVAGFYLYNSLKPSRQIAAKVGNIIIYVDELNAEFDKMPEQYKSLLTKSDYLQKVMIPQRILIEKSSSISKDEVDKAYNEFLALGNMTEKEVNDLLVQQGITLQKLKELIRVQIYLNKTLYSKITVSEQEMQDFYNIAKDSMVDENGTVISYENIKDEIKSYLSAQKLAYETQAYLDELLKKEKIEIFFKEENETNKNFSQNMPNPKVNDSLSEMTFSDTGDEICTIDGKPVIRLFSTTWCPHCKWIKETFDTTVKEYVDSGLIVAHHWELDTNDDSLTKEVEKEVPKSEMDIYKKYNPGGSIPTFVFGCKYVRIGNGYESSNNLEAEKAEFKMLIEDLIMQAE